MKEKTKLTRILYYAGVVAMILGAVYPLEGSVLILSGNLLLVISMYITNDRQRKQFLATLIMIAVGVFFIYFTWSLREFGGTSKLIWLWDILILLYPAGWIFAMVMLIIRVRQKRKAKCLT